MLQWKAESGHVLYLNHLFAFAAVMVFGTWVCWRINKREYDKVIHAAVCGAITLGGILVFNLMDWGWWIAPIVAMVIGFGKEIADRLNKKKQLFDWKDILADLYGAGVVTLFYLFAKVLYDPSV